MMLPLAEISTAAVGAGLVIVGAGLGIGMVFFGGLQSMARQPELQAKLQTAMIIGTGGLILKMVFNDSSLFLEDNLKTAFGGCTAIHRAVFPIYNKLPVRCCSGSIKENIVDP